MSFEFQLWSDLHLEITDLYLPSIYIPRAQYLILAGDIGVPNSFRYLTLLRKVASSHQNVFIITGNHEYYNTSVSECDTQMEHMCRSVGPNVIFLNNTTFDIESLQCRVVGSTLWSEVQDDQRSNVSCFISDHRRIHHWDVEINNNRHKLNVSFIEHEIQRATQDGIRLIIVTHHAPMTKGVCKPQHMHSNLSSSFQTDLTHLLGPPVSVWCFGHTHHCSQQVVNGTHVISNQRGYVRLDAMRTREDEFFEIDKGFKG